MSVATISNKTEEGIIFLRRTGKAVVTKRSPFSGKFHDMTMELTDDQYSNWLSGGQMIQNALSHLDADAREFLMTGITPEEWEATFPPEEDDE